MNIDHIEPLDIGDNPTDAQLEAGAHAIVSGHAITGDIDACLALVRAYRKLGPETAGDVQLYERAKRAIGAVR